jgi:RND superfamily putative drug exporter
VLVWVVGAILVGVTSGIVGSSTGQDFQPPGFESTRGIDTLNDEFGGTGAGIQGTIVFRAEQGVDDPAVQATMEQLFAQVTALAANPKVDLATDPAFAGVSKARRRALASHDLSLFKGLTLVSPYAPGGATQIAAQGREAGKVAFASLEVAGDEWKHAQAIGRSIEEILPAQAGLQVELGGEALGRFDEPSSETLGLAFAVVILVVAFGSVLAMGLPIGVAISGIITGTLIVSILSNLITLPDFTRFLGIMIGLGVGIDYALFIVTRYRENLRHGHTPEEAASVAIDTAGRAVAFAGVTVVISFLGMMVMGVSFIQGIAISSALVVAMTVLASLTLLPALLGFVGDRIEATRWRGVIATGLVAVGLAGLGLELMPLAIAGFALAVAVFVAGFFVAPLKREMPRRPPKPLRQTWAYRWSRLIQHHPWPAAIAGALILLVLALPVLGMRLGFADEGNMPKSTTTRQAYDLLVDGFGPGFNGPFVLVARVEGPADPAALAKVTDAVAADREVAFVSSPIPNRPETTSAYLWQVTPKSAPQDAATTSLVHRLRDEVLDDGERALGTEVAVTGKGPAMTDFSDFLAGRMPWFFVAVLTLSFLLMMAVFRSVLVPLKAVLMNLLSIGAAYGITVAIVQWGWLSDITGMAPGPVETFAPMMFFAIVFGLSMDYEVFLLSRVREEYHRTGDNYTSVANGLAATARVITAAAAIMVFVFGSFFLDNDRIFKLMGMGLASAIFLDATIVRMVLVPATMELLGDRNWWLPKWLDRLIPAIDVEGHPDDDGDDPEDDDPEDDELERELAPV